MNIFHKVALQGLRKSRTRTFVTIIGVMLSAALFTGVATFAVSLQSYMIHGAETKYGSWHVELPDTNAAFAADAAADSRVLDAVTLQNLGYAALEDSKNDAKPYLFLSGWDQKAFASLPINLLSGRLPENDSEVLVPAHLAANGGVNIPIGAELTLSVGTRQTGDAALSQHDPYRPGEEVFRPRFEKTYTVVGICQRPAIEERTAPGYTLITAAADDAPASLTAFITLSNPYRLHSYTKDLTGYVLNGDVLRFMGLSGDRVFTLYLLSILVVLIVLVVVGSVFLIYNAFNISLSERTHQFGILMSVGATAKQLRGSVLFEGLCIGVIGIPLGILIGLPGTGLILSLVEQNFKNVMYADVALSLTVSVPAILAAAAVSLVTILISAYIPAKKAAAVPVMECIRQTGEIKLSAKELKSSRFARRFLGLEQTLALKNFKRNRRRYRSIVLSLTFSVVLFILSSAFCGYLNQSAENSNEVIEEYDIVFSSRDIAESDLFGLYDTMKNVAGVTASSYQANISYPCVIDAGQLSDHFLETFGSFIDYDGKTAKAMLDAVFVDDAAYNALLDRLGLPAEEYTGADDRMIMAAFIDGYLYLQDEPMEFMLPDASGGCKTVRVSYIRDYLDLLPRDAGDENFRGYSLLLVAPYEAKARFDALGTAVEGKLGLTFHSDNPGGSTSQMQTIIDAAGVTADYSLLNLYAILEQNRNLSFIINLFAVFFIAMITLIAVANVFNTISTNIKLRRRELAMLRSVGMSDRDFNRMMRFECFLYGARTVLWSLPLSAVLSVLLYQVMVLGGGFELTFLFPWGSMGASILGVFLIVFITMLYAASRIRRENIIDAMRDEMT